MATGETGFDDGSFDVISQRAKECHQFLKEMATSGHATPAAS